MFNVQRSIARASCSYSGVREASCLLVQQQAASSLALCAPVRLIAVRGFSSGSRRKKEGSIERLPDRVTLSTGPLGRLSKILPPRQSTSITTRVGSSFGGHHSLEWQQRPNNILIVKKKSDAKTSKALRGVIEHIRHAHPHMNIVVESESRQEIPDEYNVRFFDPQDRQYLASKIDLVVTLGGDGTILHVSSLFERSDVPPILSFSMGTLGFLMPFHINTFATAFKEVVQSRATLLLRMRLCQTTHNADGSLLARSDGESSEIHLMNEVALHRASSPHMTTMDAFVDGRHLTQSISDGLIIATPTGSTAYSLSAGGPIVHPSVQSILLTPICPRSLSFRPVLLPSDAHVQLRVSEKSRAAAQVSVDGREVQALEPGQYLQVAMSPYPIPCVNRTSPHMSTRTGQLSSTEEGIASSLPPSDRGEDDWAGDINTLLRFNASFSGRGLLGGNGSYEDID